MAFGFFDGNKADASPESIKRKREMIARMMASSRAPRNIGEGLNSIGDSIASSILGYRADKAERANEAERASIMGGINFGGGGAPMASAGNPVATGSATGSGATDDTYTGAPRGLFASESGGRFTAQNDVTGAGGMKGHFGRVQFGQARLQEAAAAGAIPQGTTPQQFMASPELQRAAERWHFADIDNRIKGSGIDQRFGQTINGVPITRDGLVAVAHLGGIKGMQRFVETGGRYNPRDANGTSLMDYFARMGGQRQMASRMPVINPGAGAAQMPLARQPNVALADMPAPGANQSGMNVAPVQGDNAQQLLADADYYEQNGNPEAARQMRERAQMAGQLPAPDGVFQAPLDGSQPDPLRDMFSARDVGFADNEAETQGFEARMAQDQAGVPMPDPSQVQTVAITPNAQNADDVFSPVPMGLGPNPFLPRNIDPPADVAASGAEPTAVSPRMVSAPMPPPRPANIQPPQSPFVPPAMRQPMSMDFGGENSGGAMQFIESEFARREGRPDPRTAMGAPGQIYNPFVQQPPQAPQMPAGGGSVQGVSQGGAMASGPAQAPAQAQQGGMITPQYVQAVMSSPVTSEADKRFVMDMYNQQRAAQQAEAERARVQAQNRQTARDLGIPESLGGVGPVVTARAQQMFAKPEGATSDQRELEQVNRERQAANLPPLRMDEWKTQKARAGATSVSVNTGSKAEEKFSEAFAKGDADALGTIATAGMAAQRNISRIDRLEALLNASPTGGLAVLQQRAGEFGINTKGLSEIQAAQALINSLVPEQRQPGSGPMSDADLALYKESLVRIINQPDGNKRIIESLRGIAKYDAEGAVIVQQLRENKINRAQAFEALQNRVNPLAEFSQPPARTGQPSQAEIEAEMKRRGLR